jgi:hypothetical protein
VAVFAFGRPLGAEFSVSEPDSQIEFSWAYATYAQGTVVGADGPGRLCGECWRRPADTESTYQFGVQFGSGWIFQALA